MFGWSPNVCISVLENGIRCYHESWAVSGQNRRGHVISPIWPLSTAEDGTGMDASVQKAHSALRKHYGYSRRLGCGEIPLFNDSGGSSLSALTLPIRYGAVSEYYSPFFDSLWLSFIVAFLLSSHLR